MDCKEPDEAKEALRQREGCNAKDIHAWSNGKEAPEAIHDIETWADSRSIETVVWTGLPTKFKGSNGNVPKIDEVLSHLDGLLGAERDNAERYVRNTPRQIDTPYRRQIEASLGWTYRDSS